MDTTSALFASALIIIIILLVAAYIWYNFIGWTEFNATTGDQPIWKPDVAISRLRFKDCIFTVTRSDGVSQSLDVSQVLNGMVVAFKNSTLDVAEPLKLVRPLNPFSFVIAGFNDKATVSDPSIPLWNVKNGATATLSGKWRNI